jgi:Vacuolar protein sorting-associated protein 62
MSGGCRERQFLQVLAVAVNSGFVAHPLSKQGPSVLLCMAHRTKVHPIGRSAPFMGTETSGGRSARPLLQVLAVAVNSGFVAHPLGYDLVWANGGVSIWRPQPPEGYRALGCIAGRGAARPSLTACVCVHHHACVEVRAYAGGVCCARSVWRCSRCGMPGSRRQTG